MNDAPRHRERPLISLFTAHWLAMVGLGLVVTAIATWAFLLPVRLRTGAENPDIGLATLAVPAILIAGLVLTPLGVWLGRARLRRKLSEGTFDRRVALRAASAVGEADPEILDTPGLSAPIRRMGKS